VRIDLVTTPLATGRRYGVAELLGPWICALARPARRLTARAPVRARVATFDIEILQ
jgi:hypothetical protein